MPQAVGLLFKKVKQLNIDTIVVGYNAGWKQESDMGKKNNQQFVQIPFHKLISSIENKCLKEGIRFKKQEESYTSKASFLDRDTIPVGRRTIRRTTHSVVNVYIVVSIKVKLDHVSTVTSTAH